jgi:hypothetical protein
VILHCLLTEFPVLIVTWCPWKHKTLRGSVNKHLQLNMIVSLKLSATTLQKSWSPFCSTKFSFVHFNLNFGMWSSVVKFHTLIFYFLSNVLFVYQKLNVPAHVVPNREHGQCHGSIPGHWPQRPELNELLNYVRFSTDKKAALGLIFLRVQFH